MVKSLGLSVVVLAACEKSPAPVQLPTGRMLSGLVRCDAERRCPDAGTCFVSLFDRAPTCTGEGKSPCDVMQCDAPATCRCLETTPRQCGCGISYRAQ